MRHRKGKLISLGVIATSIVVGITWYNYNNILPYKRLSGTWALIEENKWGPNKGCDIRFRFYENGRTFSINNKRLEHGIYTLKPLETGYRFSVTSVDFNNGLDCTKKVLSKIHKGFTRTGFLQLNIDATAFRYCGDSIGRDGYKKSRVCTIYARIDDDKEFVPK